MDNLNPEDLFFNSSDLDEVSVSNLVTSSLHGMDDGELFLEYCQSEALVFDDGRLKSSSFNTDRGFGIRGIFGESTGYAHSSEISTDSIRLSSEAIQEVRSGYSGNISIL